MGLFSFLRRDNAAEEAAIALYGAIVNQSRTATFYSELGVPDSLNGRFDMIIIHATLAMRRLRQEPQAVREPMSQALFDYMFKDMDRSLREVGVGDMSIGKHIKKMAKAFYGRAEEYEDGLDGGDAKFAAALKANLYRSLVPTESQLQSFMQYLREADKALPLATIEDISSGRFQWPQVRVPA